MKRLEQEFWLRTMRPGCNYDYFGGESVIHTLGQRIYKEMKIYQYYKTFVFPFVQIDEINDVKTKELVLQNETFIFQQKGFGLQDISTSFTVYYFQSQSI